MSSKGSLVLARLKQTVGIGQHTEDNELEEAIERLNHALAEAQGLRIKLVKLKGAVTATNAARAAVMSSVVSSSGVETTQGAVVDRLNKVVSVYAHQDGDLAEALGTVYDQVVLGEANEWCGSLEALQAAVETHEVDRVKYDHYEDKVKGLRDARRARIAKGKTESDRDAGKLKRNEDKLAEAKAAFYDSRTTLLANLNAAHAQRAARCQRVVLRLLQYDFKRSQEAQRGCDSLQHILEAMNSSVKSGQLEEQAAASQASASSRPPRPRVSTAGSTGAVMVAEAASAVADNSGGETPEAKQNDMSARLGRRAAGAGNPFGDSDDEDTPASSEKPPVNSATSSGPRGTFHDASAPAAAAAAATPPGPSPAASPVRGGGAQPHSDEGMGGRFMSWVRRKSTIAGGSKPQRQALGDDEAEETLSRGAPKPPAGTGRARAATASSVTTAAAASPAPPPPPRRASLDPSSVAATAAVATSATASVAATTPAVPPAAYDPFAASAPSSSPPPPAVEPTPAPLAPPAAATTNTRRRARGSSRGSVGVLSPSPSPDFTVPQASPPVATTGTWDAFGANPTTTTTTAAAASPSPPSAAAAGADPWAAFGNASASSTGGVFDPFAAGSAVPASTVAVPATEPAGGAPSLSPAPVGLDPFDAFVVLPSGPAAAQPRPDVLPPVTAAPTPTTVRADDGNPSGGAFNPFG